MEEVDLREYARLLYEGQIFEEEQRAEAFQSVNEDLGEITPNDVTQTTYYFYNETKKQVVNGSQVKVSAGQMGPSTINVVYSATITHGFSIPLSINVSAMKDKIKANAGFTWNSSLSTTTSIGGSFEVAAGKVGYLGFTPYLNKTIGTAYTEIRYSNGNVTRTPTENVSGTSPIKLSNGVADGMYAIVYK